ncbi:hypothetical protein [Nocardia sp. NPDC024068]|uniref:hypothetical protein n=1 Tax=Nocardia sp. NPDC024068 TaxID=3157197 RepID=UPI0033CD677B
MADYGGPAGPQDVSVVPDEVRSVGRYVYGIADALRRALESAGSEVDSLTDGSWVGDDAAEFAVGWADVRDGGVQNYAGRQSWCDDRTGGMMDSSDFIARLRSFGSLEWYRHAGGGVDGEHFRPPLVVWRFAEPWPVRVSEALERIVADEQREVDWLFDTARRNWVLVPSFVMEEKARHGFATEAHAADLISRENPEYSRRSVRDFDRIIVALDSVPGI